MVVDKYQARLVRERLLMMEILDEKVVAAPPAPAMAKLPMPIVPLSCYSGRLRQN
jgi:hypothetical protein